MISRINRNPLAEGFDSNKSHYYTLDSGEIVTPEWAAQEITKRLYSPGGLLFTLEDREKLAQIVTDGRCAKQTLTSLEYSARFVHFPELEVPYPRKR